MLLPLARMRRAPARRSALITDGSAKDILPAIEAQLERVAPGFRDRVLVRHVMGPAALEAWNANLVGGDIGGGATDWSQLAAGVALAQLR